MKKVMILVCSVAALAGAFAPPNPAATAPGAVLPAAAPQWGRLNLSGPLSASVLETYAANPMEIFAVADGSLFRTRDSGLSWTRLSDVPAKWVFDIAVDPTNDLYVYVLGIVSGEDFARVLRSTDGGLSWRALPKLAATTVSKIEVNPASPNVLLVGAEVYRAGNVYEDWNAILRSSDRGQTWTTLVAGHYHAIFGSAQSMAMCPAKPGYVYLAGVGHNLNGVAYRTANGGSSWTDITPPLGDMPGEIRVDAANPLRVFMTAYSATGRYSIYGSLNGGGTWTRADSTDPRSVLLVPPNAPGVVEAAQVAYFRSINNGSTWTRVGTAPFAVVDLDVANGVRFISGGKGVYRSLTRGGTWAPSLTGSRSIRAIGVAASSPNRLYACVGTSMARSGDAGVTWTLLSGMFQPAGLWVSPSSPGTLLMLNQGFLGWSQLLKSTTSGATWTNIAPAGWEPLAVTLAGGFNRITAAVRTSAQGLSLARSIDGGINWTTSAIAATVPAFVRAVAVDPISYNTVYVGAGAVAYRTLNGTTWASASLPAGAGEILVLATAPQRPGVVFAGTTTGLYRSLDRGASWAKVGGFAVSAILPPPTATGRMFAGGKAGIFTSVNGGTTWSSWNTGLGNVEVRTLAMSATQLRLYAAMAGGLWRTLFTWT